MSKINKNFLYSKENYVKNIAMSDIEKLPNFIDSHVGLNFDSREINVNKFGSNKVAVKKFNKFKKFFQCFIELFNLMLFAVGLTELVLFFTIDKDIINLVSSIIVFFMIGIAVFVDFSQSVSAHKTALMMHRKIENLVFVLNDKVDLSKKQKLFNLKQNLITVKESELTIGDVIFLSKGDIVPSDCRIIELYGLQVDQSSLTGENDYISKKLKNTKSNLLELENILFAETIVKEGNCFAVVINISENNYSNSISSVVDDLETKSDYEKSLTKITKILILSILIIAPIIFLIIWASSGFDKNKVASPIIFSLSIAVALIPEALPAIIASNLKLGSKKLAKNKVIVKNLESVQNMGGVDILATDKTGTLTLNELKVQQIIDINFKESNWLNEITKISCESSNTLSNKFDVAIKYYFKDLKVEYNLKEINDFSHFTRISSIFVSYKNKDVLIVKGSFEEVISKVKFVNSNNKILSFDESLLNKAIEFHNYQASVGNKLIVVASKEKNTNSEDLTLEGFVCLIEKIKPDVKSVINTFMKYSIDVKVLTGDNKEVSENLMKSIVDKTNSISGEQLNDDKKIILSTINLFYKLSPLDKAFIVKKLQKESVVAFLGDGVNDAVALKQADVGISVNNACALAKQSADIIMLEKDLIVLEEAFIEGRKTFANAVKYVKITLASNFGLLLTLLISSIWFSIMTINKTTFLPISPIQLLLQNLIFDFANLIFVLDKTDSEVIAKPCKWSTKSIIPFAFWNGLVHVFVSTINFLILGYAFNLFKKIDSNDPNALNMFQTAFFIEIILTHIVLIISYRTEKISILKSRPSNIFSVFMVFFSLSPFLIIGLDQTINKMNFKFMSGENNSWWFLVILGLVFFAWFLAETLKFTYLKVFKFWI